MENPFEIILQKLENIEKSLEDLKNKGIETPSNKLDIFNTEEVADYIRLTVPTIYGLVHRNKIPYCKKGKKLYFVKSDIDKWILEGRNKTTSELNLLADKYLMKHRL
ncbi:helix-turn-helix domain-containing protein [Flavobacterium sp.]|uniref:helix-turn-helix domain-containing protein n=1 Tax=Flavobacterium sp. TaxID=239 RepID=UPI002487B5F6|nr:helix-turn-helix domain-containing protein [Flavobacterium sp.]MDI1318086.1 helix-turn-helix domain-containing protein [Flavobacterium sp.]